MGWDKPSPSTVINVKSYGAIGDGVTDDTAAIQTALTAAPAGAIILFPDAIFAVKGPLNVTTAKVQIVGPGTLRNINPSLTSATFVYLLEIKADDVIIDGLTMDNPTYATWIGAINIQGNRCTVEGCRIDGFTEGIQSTQNGYVGCKAVSNQVTNVVGVASENIGDGICFLTPQSIIADNFITCKAGTDGRVGACIDTAGNYSTVTGNVIQGPFRRSVHCELSPETTISGNSCTGATQWGIICQSSDCTVTGNTVQTPAASPGPLGAGTIVAGIHSNQSAVDITVTDNVVISGGAGQGIVLYGTRFVISDNVITGAASSLTNAIYAQGTDFSVSGNKVDAGVCSSDGIYCYSCPGVRVIGNTVERTLASGINVSNSIKAAIMGNLAKNCANYGIIAQNASDDAIIEGNHCYDDQTTKTQLYGVDIYASNNPRIIGNNVVGNLTGGVGYGGTVNTPNAAFNAGYNPRGALTAPGVPASGTVLTNTFDVQVRVAVSGGTVSQIAINGANTGLISGMFVLSPGETITLTYSAAPTWIWQGL